MKASSCCWFHSIFSPLGTLLERKFHQNLRQWGRLTLTSQAVRFVPSVHEWSYPLTITSLKLVQNSIECNRRLIWMLLVLKRKKKNAITYGYAMRQAKGEYFLRIATISHSSCLVFHCRTLAYVKHQLSCETSKNFSFSCSRRSTTTNAVSSSLTALLVAVSVRCAWTVSHFFPRKSIWLQRNFQLLFDR